MKLLELLVNKEKIAEHLSIQGVAWIVILSMLFWLVSAGLVDRWAWSQEVKDLRKDTEQQLDTQFTLLIQTRLSIAEGQLHEIKRELFSYKQSVTESPEVQLLILQAETRKTKLEKQVTCLESARVFKDGVCTPLHTNGRKN